MPAADRLRQIEVNMGGVAVAPRRARRAPRSGNIADLRSRNDFTLMSMRASWERLPETFFALLAGSPMWNSIYWNISSICQHEIILIRKTGRTGRNKIRVYWGQTFARRITPPPSTGKGTGFSTPRHDRPENLWGREIPVSQRRRLD
jgi:hypothetical protein